MLGRRLASELGELRFVALSGDLGTGKTALIRGMCEYFGQGEQVGSPTFTIINEYPGRPLIYHVDLYRLSTVHEMIEVGLDELFLSDNIVFVEWAERARTLLPLPRLEIAARHGDSVHTRHYTVQRTANDQASILFEPAELPRISV